MQTRVHPDQPFGIPVGLVTTPNVSLITSLRPCFTIYSLSARPSILSSVKNNYFQTVLIVPALSLTPCSSRLMNTSRSNVLMMRFTITLFNCFSSILLRYFCLRFRPRKTNLMKIQRGSQNCPIISWIILYYNIIYKL